MKQSFMQGAQRPNARGMHPAMHELVSDRLGNRALWILDALYAAYCAGPLRLSEPSMKIIVPAPRSAIPPTTAWVQKNGP
jgi:hypothetical protein